MLSSLLKFPVAVLLGVAICNVVSAVPNNHDLKRDGDMVYIARNAFAPAVCEAGKNDPDTCWKYNMGEHVIQGEPARCFGGHITTAIQFAEQKKEITNSRPIEWDPITSLILINYTDGSGKSCSKTVWNNAVNYPPSSPVPQYPPLPIENMCKSAVRYSNCVSGAIVVDTTFVDHNRKPIYICVQVEIDIRTDPTYPGRSCYPKYLPKNKNGPLGRVEGIALGQSCAHLA